MPSNHFPPQGFTPGPIQGEYHKYLTTTYLIQRFRQNKIFDKKHTGRFKKYFGGRKFEISSVRCVLMLVYGSSSIGPTLAFLTSLPVQDGGPHDTKMAAPTTSGPRWRPPRHQDGGPHDTKMAAPVTRSVTPRRVSQRPRPREGSVKS